MVNVAQPTPGTAFVSSPPATPSYQRKDLYEKHPPSIMKCKKKKPQVALPNKIAPENIEKCRQSLSANWNPPAFPTNNSPI